jgi:hypothetical protein
MVKQTSRHKISLFGDVLGHNIQHDEVRILVLLLEFVRTHNLRLHWACKERSQALKLSDFKSTLYYASLK